mmetsp:Transcript_20284/g.57110  ORF Transcript_20284/g.57110 Transcript_20284/m.57110 type:complete len:262 (-) Transcript_20284:469-1254(-)
MANSGFSETFPAVSTRVYNISDVVGFTNTPFVLCIAVWSVTVSLLGSTLFGESALTLQSINAQIIEHGEIWRLFTAPFFFSNRFALVISCIILYSLRLVERLMGTRKYLDLVVSNFVICALLRVAAWGMGLTTSVVGGGMILDLLFASMVEYWRIVPASIRFVVVVSFSEKTLLYLLAAQLSLTFLPASGIAATVGAMSGLLHLLPPGTSPKDVQVVSWLCQRAPVLQRALSGSVQVVRAQGPHRRGQVRSSDLTTACIDV